MTSRSESSGLPVGALLSLPLFLDMALGLTTPIDFLSDVIGLCWWASVVISVIALSRTVRAKQRVGLVLLLTLTPFVVFFLGFLPIWPLVSVR